MELSEVRLVLASKELVKKGDPADAMYLIVDGELRVRMLLDGKEKRQFHENEPWLMHPQE